MSSISRHDLRSVIMTTPRSDTGPMITDAPVLIVDDNATNPRSVQYSAYLGMKPVVAESASECRDAPTGSAGAQPFHLVISDVNMPDVDGFMLARQIRDDANLRLTPVIVRSPPVVAQGDAVKRRDLM